MKWVVLIVLGILLASNVFAHGTSYFNFRPDSSQSFSFLEATSVVEVFLPQNEFLGGVDLWVDNSGSSGTLSVQLRTTTGQLVTSGSVTVPHINPISGGQRIHIEFQSQPNVVHNNRYRLVFTSSLPELRIYYGDRILFLEHDAPQVSAYINGAAEIDGEEKEFSFLFGLYEYSESSPPVIIDHAAVVLGQSQTRIDFHVNEIVDYKVAYGIQGSGTVVDTGYTGSYVYCGVITCSVYLNTTQGSAYDYTLSVKDVWGNETSAVGTFISGQPGQTITPTPTVSITPTPSPTPDTSAPLITNLQIVELQATSAKFVWTTDEAANSFLLVQSLPNLLGVGTVNDQTLELEHSLTISNLSPNRSYHAEINSSDAYGNIAGQVMEFSTPSSLPTTSPSPNQTSSPTPLPSPEIEDTDGGETEIQWQSSGDDQTTYRIDIFDENNNLIETITITGDTKVITSKLPPNSRVIIYRDNNGAYEKIAVSGGQALNRPHSRSAMEKFFAALADNLIYVVMVGVALISGLVFLLKHLKKKQKPPTAPPPPDESGGQINYGSSV